MHDVYPTQLKGLLKLLALSHLAALVRRLEAAFGVREKQQKHDKFSLLTPATAAGAILLFQAADRAANL